LQASIHKAYITLASPRGSGGVEIAGINRREPGGISPANRGGGGVPPLYKVVRKKNRLMMWTV
jgi:hypothetical protein